MSLDPLNVGRLQTCGENLVIAFPWDFFLSTMNVTSFFVCKLALFRCFNKLTGNIILTFHISKGQNNSPFHRKTQTMTENPLKVCFFLFFNAEEAAE